MGAKDPPASLRRSLRVQHVVYFKSSAGFRVLPWTEMGCAASMEAFFAESKPLPPQWTGPGGMMLQGVWGTADGSEYKESHTMNQGIIDHPRPKGVILAL